jgi:hypothetical protein
MSEDFLGQRNEGLVDCAMSEGGREGAGRGTYF